MLQQKNKVTFLIWFAWLNAALFYGYDFLVKVSPHSMTNELMRDFMIDNTQLGNLSGYYYYFYALSLLPAGFLLDKYNYNVILFLSALSVSLASFSLAYTDHIAIAYISRALAGIGAAFAFSGCLKLVADWLPSRKFPLIVGITDLFGKFGGILAARPLTWLVTQQGWREAINLLAYTGMFIAVLLFINIIILRVAKKYYEKVEQNSPSKLKTISARTLLQGLTTIVRSKQTWLLALYGGLLVAPIVGYVELWGTPFLVSAYGVSKPTAASINSYVYIGIACGGPTIGLLSSWLKDYRRTMFYCTLIALLSFSIVIYIKLNLVIVSALLFLYGACTSNMLLCFTLAKSLHNKNVSALAIGFTNTVINAFGAISQPLIGLVLDHFITTNSKVVQIYPVENFQIAFIILPLCLILALPLTRSFKVQLNNI